MLLKSNTAVLIILGTNPAFSGKKSQHPK